METEHLSVLALCEGKLKGAPLLGTLKVMYREVLVMGISFHRGPVGEPGRGLLYRGL